MPITFTITKRNQLLRFLRIGKGNAIKASVIARHIGLSQGGTEPKTRKLITECIDVDGDLIASSMTKPKGFYKINTIIELDGYLDTLENRAKEINDRRSSLINNWNNNNPTSLTNKRVKRY